MEFSKLIMERRSVRGYAEGKEISREVIEEIIKDAQKAPSWKNSQNARYYAAVTPEGIDKVRACLPGFNQESSKGCCAYIVTSFVKKIAGHDKQGNPDNEMGDLWGAYDLGLNNAYLVLAAADRGIDSLIMGIRAGEALSSALGIPENEQVSAVISLGYRKEDPQFFPRKDLDRVAKFF